MADQPEADDGDPRARTDLGQTEPVQRDRPDRGERSVGVTHPLGEACRQQARDGLDSRVPGPSGSHAVPRTDADHRFTHLEHRPGGGVAQWHLLVEAGADGPHGLQHTVGTGLAQYLTYQIGPGSSLFDQVG